MVTRRRRSTDARDGASASPVFCAVDTGDLGVATTLAARIADSVGGIKLGLEFFVAQGAKGVAQVVRACGLPMFLDLKFHDIPNTVAGAVRSVLPLRPNLLTLHAAGGRSMLKAAAAAAADADGTPPRLLAVTVLTSLGEADIGEIGVNGTVLDQVRRLAGLAMEAGMDGLVCSAHEVAALRQDLGPDALLVVPGVRPAWAGSDDQQRVMTPAEALEAGASILVIGRPITAASDPHEAARRLGAELAQ